MNQMIWQVDYAIFITFVEAPRISIIVTINRAIITEMFENKPTSIHLLTDIYSSI